MAITTPKQVLEFAAEKKATYVDLKFMDFIGIWQHFSIPLYELTDTVAPVGMRPTASAADRTGTRRLTWRRPPGAASTTTCAGRGASARTSAP